MSREEIRQWLGEIAAHPAAYGIAAGVARWYIGDRSGGWKDLLGYVGAALIVAWAAALYLSDEPGLAVNRANFSLIVLSFVAKDILTALASLGLQLRVDPLGLLARLREAWRGGPTP